MFSKKGVFHGNRAQISDFHLSPFALSSYPCRKIEQGYLSTAPVVRIRRDNNDYILTYKSKGMMIREEYKSSADKKNPMNI